MLELFGINIKSLTDDQLLEKINLTRNNIGRFSMIGSSTEQLQHFLSLYLNEYNERQIISNQKIIDKKQSTIIDSETYGKDKTINKETAQKTLRIKKFGSDFSRKDRT